MRSTSTDPEAPVVEPSTAEAAPHAVTEDDLVTSAEELPFESPEFGVGQFFPHLYAGTDD